MHVTVQCIHCGRSLKAPREMFGKRVKCAKCEREFVLPDVLDSAIVASPSDSAIRPRPNAVPDHTLSRSMLPIRGIGPGAEPANPPDEMVCRLEPKSLRWMNITSAIGELLGSTIEQLRRQSFLEFLHPDDRALAEDEFRQAAERGERHDFVLRLQAHDERLHYMRIYTQARYNPDGTVNHIRCYLKDVTDRVRAEQELRRRTEQLTAANERLRLVNQKLKETQSQLVHTEKLAALGTLAAGMAHEINNPLAFATNNVAVLERDIADLLKLLACYQEGWNDRPGANPEIAARIGELEAEVDLSYLRKNLPRIVSATREGLGRVAKIVQNLRNFAQLDHAEIGLIDVNESLNQSLEAISDSLGRQKITVVRRYQDVPLLECAAAHLNQVFLNLLMNAMQAIEAAGKAAGQIEVATRAADGEIVVEIADDGCGIPDDVLSKIFDPFFTTKPIGRGTGLGLSISHGIISEHGGRIEVQSTVGQGTRCQIHLPIEGDVKPRLR